MIYNDSLGPINFFPCRLFREMIIVIYLSQHFENVRKGLVWACSRNEIVVEIMKGHVNQNIARVFKYYYDEIIVINKKRSKNYWRKIKWF